MHKQKGGILARAQDLASATQGECCALHLTSVPDLSDGRLAMFRSKGGKPSQYSYYWYRTIAYRVIRENETNNNMASMAGWGNNGRAETGTRGAK